jgi:hypothetical protein
LQVCAKRADHPGSRPYGRAEELPGEELREVISD